MNDEWWNSKLRNGIPSLVMREEFREEVREQIDDAWAAPVWRRSIGRRLAAAAAVVLPVGLIAALALERTRNDRPPIAVPSPEEGHVPSATAPLVTTPVGDSTQPSIPTSSPSPSATKGPVTTNDESTERPEGAVRITVPELSATSLFQATLSENDHVVTLEVTAMRTYDPSDLCTRYYEVELRETSDEVLLELVPYRPPGDPPQGCRTVGERREFRVSLSDPLGDRRVLFQGEAIEIGR